jgi:hypothetical protein
MQYKALLTILTLTSTMASPTSAGVLQKRSCSPGGRQFCCSVEEVPDKEILPNLYLFVYGLGCSKLDHFLNARVLVTYPTFAEEISLTESCNAASSQPHGICCSASNTQVRFAPLAFLLRWLANATEQTGPLNTVFCYTNHA